MAFQHQFAGLAVRDLTVAVEWYSRLFERPPDMLPHEREAVWHTSAQASIYVVEDPDRAGQGLLTLIVDDLDASLRECAIAAAIDAGPPRKATLVDPDGNAIALADLRP
ncbi:MAG: VOC family protein [Chloroflexi bacterium]|nr:VOC family protein [Chloroflexota bacterium]